MDSLCFTHQVPDAVWAAIIASLLTLGGVWLTNKGNNKRLFDQLGHDATERARERQMSIRREVYLKAAEAIPKAFTTIMGLPQADMQSHSWKSDAGSISETLMKVHIVGTDDTVTAITRFSSEFSKAILELTEKKIPLDNLKLRIDTLSNLAEKTSKERDRYLELMKEFNLQGSLDQRLWDTMVKDFEFESNRTNDYSKDHVLALQQHGTLLLELVKECYIKTRKLNNVLVPALCAVRHEMDFTFDVDRYRQLMEEVGVEMETSMNHLIDSIQTKLNESTG